jgi:hypothetical protein
MFKTDRAVEEEEKDLNLRTTGGRQIMVHVLSLISGNMGLNRQV